MKINFWVIEWNIGDFNTKELELPNYVYETSNAMLFKDQVFNQENVFVIESCKFPGKTISGVLEEKFKTSVKSIAPALEN